MTVNVGDKVVMIPLRGGGYAAVRSGDISVGDKVIMIPGQDGRYYAIKPASPSVGDRVILYPLRGGGYVCLPSADDASGEPGSAILPPINFDALRTGPSTAGLEWALNVGNDGVRIVRRADRYPTTITDGTIAYEGGGSEAVDGGLDFRERYYYSIWGRSGGRYSNGYLQGAVGAWGSYLDLPWGEFNVSISSGDGEFGGGLVSSSEYPPGQSSGISKELYFEKSGGGDPSYARATAQISGPWIRMTGWIGIHLSDITLAGGNRVQVNGTTVWQKTEAQYGGSPGSIQWVQVDIPLNGGSPISNFSLRVERYHNESYHTRFSGFFCGMRLV